MGDRTYAAGRFIAPDEKSLQVIRLAMEDRVGEASTLDIDGLLLEFTYEEISCGSADEISAAFSEAAEALATDFAYEVYEDPKYEWLGDCYTFVPMLGLHNAECQDGGGIVVSAQQIADAVRETRGRYALQDRLESLSGIKHTEAFALLADAAKQKEK